MTSLSVTGLLPLVRPVTIVRVIGAERTSVCHDCRTNNDTKAPTSEINILDSPGRKSKKEIRRLSSYQHINRVGNCIKPPKIQSEDSDWFSKSSAERKWQVWGVIVPNGGRRGGYVGSGEKPIVGKMDPS